MYLKGYTQAEIAHETGKAQSTISRDLKALQQEWLDSSLLEFNLARSLEIAKIDELEREAWLAYTRSQEDAWAKTVKDSTQGVEETETVKGQVGDPRFFGTVQWCITQRLKLFGIEPADKLELTGKDGSPLMPTANVIRVIVHGEDEE